MNEPLSSLSEDRETMERKIAFGERCGYALVSCGYSEEHKLWFAVMKNTKNEEK